MTHASPVQEKNIMLNGLRFYYRDWPNDAAPILVILPGFSSTAHSWDSFARAMQDRFRVLVLDQRGHGRTEWASDYRIERWVEDVDAEGAILLTVDATDRPGLLMAITSVLYAKQVSVLHSDLTTSGAQARARFQVVESDGAPLTSSRARDVAGALADALKQSDLD